MQLNAVSVAKIRAHFCGDDNLECVYKYITLFRFPLASNTNLSVGKSYVFTTVGDNANASLYPGKRLMFLATVITNRKQIVLAELHSLTQNIYFI